MTAGLVALLVAVFGLLAAAGGSTNVNSELITRWGANTTGYTPREPWRIVTAAFLHYNVVHVLFNGYALWFVGGILERALGGRRLLALFVLFAIGGNVIGSLWWEARLAGMIPGVPGRPARGLGRRVGSGVRAGRLRRALRAGARVAARLPRRHADLADRDRRDQLRHGQGRRRRPPGRHAGGRGRRRLDQPGAGDPGRPGWTAAAVAAGLLAVACFGLVAAEVRIG